MEDRVKQHEEAQQKIFGQTKPKLCVDCKWHYRDALLGSHRCKYPHAPLNIVSGDNDMLGCHGERNSEFRCGNNANWFEPRTVSGVWHQKPIPTSPQEKPQIVPPELARGDWDKSVAPEPPTTQQAIDYSHSMLVMRATSNPGTKTVSVHEVEPFLTVLADEVRRLRAAEESTALTPRDIKVWNSAISVCASVVYESMLVPAANRGPLAARLRSVFRA